MSREAFVRENAPCETIKYIYSSAVSAGEVLFVAGLGVLIAATDIAASTEGTYYTKGVFQFHLADSTSIAQGDKCYWDVSENHLIKSSNTSLALGDPYLGRAVADDTATSGYVDVEINNNRIDCCAGGTLLASGITIAHGLHTCVNVTLVTNATLETILLTHVLTTDVVTAGLADAPTDATANLIWAKTNAGSVTVGLTTPAGTSTRIAYKVVRSI